MQVLKPGRRTSWPHAERDEDEFIFIVSGKVDAGNDGHITPMSSGDFIGWAGGTGIAHVIINNSDEDVIVIVGTRESWIASAGRPPIVLRALSSPRRVAMHRIHGSSDRDRRTTVLVRAGES